MQGCKSQLLNFQVFCESVDKLYTFIIGTEVEKVFSLDNIIYMRKRLTVDYTLMLMTLNLWGNELTDWHPTPSGKLRLNYNHKLTTDTWVWQKSMKAFSDMTFTIKTIIYFIICKLVLYIHRISKIYSKLILTHIFILKVILFLFCILLYTKAITTTKWQRCPPRGQKLHSLSSKTLHQAFLSKFPLFLHVELQFLSSLF